MFQNVPGAGSADVCSKLKEQDRRECVLTWRIRWGHPGGRDSTPAVPPLHQVDPVLSQPERRRRKKQLARGFP